MEKNKDKTKFDIVMIVGIIVFFGGTYLSSIHEKNYEKKILTGKHSFVIGEFEPRWRGFAIRACSKQQSLKDTKLKKLKIK